MKNHIFIEDGKYLIFIRVVFRTPMLLFKSTCILILLIKANMNVKLFKRKNYIKLRKSKASNENLKILRSM